MPEFVQSEMTVIKPDGAILVSPESLEKLFDDFTKIPKNKRVNVGRIKKRFLWWSRWTPDDEIYAWFDKMYPGGLLELTRKRQIKRFGEDYVKTWEKIGKRMRSAGASYLLSVPPDLARTREFQAKSRGHRMSIQPVDDAACLTEEDKKRLLQEFAEE